MKILAENKGTMVMRVVIGKRIINTNEDHMISYRNKYSLSAAFLSDFVKYVPVCV